MLSEAGGIAVEFRDAYRDAILDPVTISERCGSEPFADNKPLRRSVSEQYADTKPPTRSVANKGRQRSAPRFVRSVPPKRGSCEDDGREAAHCNSYAASKAL